MRLRVDVARALASEVLPTTRSAIAVVPPPSARDTFARVVPALDEVVAEADRPLMTCLVAGSQPRMFTVSGCWTPLMRGRKDTRVSCQRSCSAAPLALLAGRNT